MNLEQTKNHSRYLSLLLRHKPEKENLNMDKYGYVSVNQILSKLEISKDDLDYIVDNNDKKRFIYSDNKLLIRANQGHSITVDLNLNSVIPPTVLYHGTSLKNKKNILKSGLLKGSRQHVHLSENIDTAKNVGLRYAKNEDMLWIISIDTKKMYEDRYRFFKSENDVYLIDHIPPMYLIIK